MKKLIGALIGIAGLVMLGFSVGLLGAAGVFFFVWGNNLERKV